MFDGGERSCSPPTTARWRRRRRACLHAVALTDEIDGVAIQAAINFCAVR